MLFCICVAKFGNFLDAKTKRGVCAAYLWPMAAISDAALAQIWWDGYRSASWASASHGSVIT